MYHLLPPCQYLIPSPHLTNYISPQRVQIQCLYHTDTGQFVPLSSGDNYLRGNSQIVNCLEKKYDQERTLSKVLEEHSGPI